jgi:small-conductance mechanosensitive channel
MFKVGDRIELESERVGQPPHTGTVTAITGRLLQVRWDDGRESSFIPSAGSVKVIGHEEPARA